MGCILTNGYCNYTKYAKEENFNASGNRFKENSTKNEFY